MSKASIRSHLLLLVLAVSVPLVAIVGLGIYADTQQTIHQTKTSLRMLASTMVSNTGSQIANARQIMERLALRPLIRQVDPKNCDTALKDLLSVNPGYTNVGYSDMAGVVVCSAVPQPGGMLVNYGSTPSFQTFLTLRNFSVGQPFFGSITGKWIAILREPIWNERREMVGGIHFPVDLAALDPHIPAQFLPADVRYGFFSADGSVIWRNSDPERTIGTRPNSDVARRIVEVRDGEFESQGVDGVRRFYSVVSMPETGWLAFVGVPASTVFAEASRRAFIASVVALATIMSMLLLALAIARRIARPVAELERAARAVHGGDLGVRAPVDGPRDIAAVAQEFNAMIEAQQHTDAKLRIAATAFESREGMIVTDASHVILQVNRAFTDITGYTSEEVTGQTLRLLKSGRHNAAFFAGMWESIQRTGSWEGEIWDRRKNGEVFPSWVTITAVKSDDGVVTHYVGTHADITARKAAEEEILQLAFYDQLTGLPNRRLLLDRLQQALASSARSAHYGALLFIDLDHFKTLNDTLGHDAGDLLLELAGQRLGACVCEGDTVARLGADEFVVMLEGLSEHPDEAATRAEALGEKIHATLNQAYRLGANAYHCTASIGVTLLNGHQTPVEELLKQADLAMYQSKTAGRNTLRFFDPQMQAIVIDRAALEVDLREAVRLEQFVLHYQAQVVGGGRLTGAEALVRWQHPRRGLVPPAEFIPLAEDTGLILPLGRWVMETACAQLAKWATQSDTAHLSLAVNVSAKQLHQCDFVDQVLAILTSTGANPRKLKLELTESLLVSQVENTIAKMAALKVHGVGFSLDDFGTGYSSLSYLKRLPLDQLKIDQGFVRDILIDPNDAAIAKMVVALAESLGLTVIAEGVEIEAQRDFLAHLGCHAYQGYLFSRPLPLAEFEAFAQRAC
ncbi:EAL domain-containing protein [Rhodoferax ferrireducens]|uniref:bifunctional diguanylate cyclase/phosphodiesterase n=1 Tax=Rhodoferax ferrireducens TaxID=192843 RepID=UPI001E6195BA|nr:EAL domain-containing protein [Rhodoferax ferrireducens]